MLPTTLKVSHSSAQYFKSPSRSHHSIQGCGKGVTVAYAPMIQLVQYRLLSAGAKASTALSISGEAAEFFLEPPPLIIITCWRTKWIL